LCSHGDLFAARHIGLQRHDSSLARELPLGARERAAIAIDERKPNTLARETSRHRKPDTARRTRDPRR
jgi:hypothetical protein